MWGEWAEGWRYAGGMTFRGGHDLLLERSCALLYTSAGTPEAAELRRASSILADLDHPHLAPLSAMFDETRPHTVRGTREPLVGHALIWSQDTPLVTRMADAPLETRRQGLEQVAEVLRYLHQRGFAHGDLQALDLSWHGGRTTVLCASPRPLTDDGAADLAALAAIARELGVDPEPLTASRRCMAGGGPWQRPRWVQALLQVALDSTDGAFFTLQGPGGSGRTRLARHLLARAAARSLPTLDLSHTERPLATLHRLLGTPGSEPTWDRPWLEQMLASIAARPWRGVLHLGRLDGPTGRNQRLLVRIGRALAEHGALVTLAAPWVAPHSQGLPMPELSPSERRALTGWAGHPHSGPGTPDRVVRQARLQALADCCLGDDAVAALATLATLPSGVPSRVVGVLPPEVRRALPELTRRAYARFDAAGTLFCDPPTGPKAPIDDTTAKAVRKVLADPVADLDPLWTAACWCALGQPNRAAQHLDAAIAVAGDRQEQLAGLCIDLIRAGHMEALPHYARIQLERGRPHRALVALKRAPDTPENRYLLARARRLSGDSVGAVAVGQSLLLKGQPPGLLLELALAHLDLGQVDAAQRIAALLQRAGADTTYLQVLLASHGIDRGLPVDPESLYDLVREVEPGSPVPGVLGTVLLRLGHAQRALPLLEEGARHGESMERPAWAALFRLHAGRALLELGRARQAHIAFQLAQEAAIAGGLVELRAQALGELIALAQAQGQLDEASEHATMLRDTMEQPTIAQAVALGHLYLAQDEPEQALLALDRAPHGTTELAILRGRALLASGRVVEARRLVDTLEPPTVPRLAHEFTELRGQLHAMRGRQLLARAGAATAEVPNSGVRPVADVPATGGDVLEMMELVAVTDALRSCGWQQAQAADLLAISKYRLHRILQKHGLLDWVREHRNEERLRHPG